MYVTIAILQALLGFAEAQAGEKNAHRPPRCRSAHRARHLGDRWFVIFDLLGLAEALLAGERTARGRPALRGGPALTQTLDTPSGGDFQRLFATMTRLREEGSIAAHWAEAPRWASTRPSQWRSPSRCPRRPAPPRAARAPPCTRAPTRREPLTRREGEIARLLARGDGDRQIADTLFISVGTVGWHVHCILRKLGLQSRHQVADWLRTEPPNADHPN